MSRQGNAARIEIELADVGTAKDSSGLPSPPSRYHELRQGQPGRTCLSSDCLRTCIYFPFTLVCLIVVILICWPYSLLRDLGNQLLNRDFVQVLLTCSFGLAKHAFRCSFELIISLLGKWDHALEKSCQWRLAPLTNLLIMVPWPHGDSEKLRAIAAARLGGTVATMTSLEDLEDRDLREARRLAINLLGRFYGPRSLYWCGDRKWLEELQKYESLGANLDFPKPTGSSLLHMAYKHGHFDCAGFLLSKGVSANSRNRTKNTPLHNLVKHQLWSERLPRAAEVPSALGKLLAYNGQGGTDPNVYNFKGLTPYMYTRAGSKAVQLLAPSPSWSDFEAVLLKSHHVDHLCPSIMELIRSSRTHSSAFSIEMEEHQPPPEKHWAHEEDRASLMFQNKRFGVQALRVADMLFCRHEGDDEVLKNRRIFLFNHFLRPMILRSVEGPLGSDSTALVRHISLAMEGPPRAAGTSRQGYQAEYETVLKDAEKTIESKYSAARDLLLAEPSAPALFDIPKKIYNVPDSDMCHARFTPAPRFAYTCCLIEAARELQEVGVIRSPAEFCDLLQQGRHRLIPEAQHELFRKSSSLDFWIALVLLWSLGVHEQLHKPFAEAMQSRAQPGELSVAPLKGFARSFEKAKDYIVDKKLESWTEKVLSALYVIDVLRCCFTVGSTARNLSLGQDLEAGFHVARQKNTHQRSNESYADRKYNLVFASGRFSVICEVQIIMASYIKIKEFGHLLYEFRR